MVVVTTQSKIRICLDPQDLKKAVICPKYQRPTLDELLPKLSEAKVFTTLDAKNGFYQVGLDEQSSLNFNLEVKYKPGTQMFIADHLSRASLKATETTQDNFQVFALELESLSPFDSIKVTPERLKQLQKATAHDLALETLKTTVVTGWPERKEQGPIRVRDFWNYREEISLHNGNLFKNQRVIVP